MKAIIIRKTDETIDCDRTNIREQIENLFDDPDILQIKEFKNEESMLQIIHDTLIGVGKPSIGLTVCNIWENKDTIYAGYFIDLTEMVDHSKEIDQETINKIKFNNLGAQITYQHVTSDLIIIKKKLNYTLNGTNISTKTTPDSVEVYDLINTLENVFVKEGVVIDINGNMQTYTYIMNPIEHLMLTDAKYETNYVCHEYEVYTHVMIIVADLREINGKLNKTATLLAGKPVNGTVFVALYKKPEFNEQPPYVGLTINRLNNILKIREKSASFTTGMERSDREYVNFEKIIEIEIDKYSKHPSIEPESIVGELLNIK